ncbi:MAG: LytR C-terminal domain-containing protein [Actinomycetota bacterium]|nr:LytR C-terminal domain-containing protein [Actinomycetota bacterium]
MDAPVLWSTSRIYFAPGYEAEALDVARLLGLGMSAVNRTPPPVPDPNGADVLVVIGQDLVGTS